VCSSSSALLPSSVCYLDLAISEVNERVRVVADLLQSVPDQKTIASLKESVDNLQQVTRTLASNNEKLRSIIVDTARASNELMPLLKSSNEAVKTLQMQTLPQTHQTLSELGHLSDSLRGVAASSNDTIRALQTQLLPQAYRALADLDDLSNSFNGAAVQINRDPSILIRGAGSPDRARRDECALLPSDHVYGSCRSYRVHAGGMHAAIAGQGRGPEGSPEQDAGRTSSRADTPGHIASASRGERTDL